MAELTKQIESLIAYANETTQKGDDSLGEAIKSLADGYNGVGSQQSFPTISNADTLSSQISALIAYSNNITGKADVTIGNAVKSLVDGYGEGSILPSEYQAVEYIESTGKQKIDTGIVVSRDVQSANIVFRVTEYKQLGFVFGTAWENTALGVGQSDYFFQNFYFDDKYYLSNIRVANYINTTLRWELIGSQNTVRFKINNSETELFSYVSKKTKTTSSTFKLFGFGKYLSKMRLYEAQLYESPSVQFKYIPCYRKKDHIAGLYDVVSGRFLTNSYSSDNFNVGKDINF